MKGNKKTQKTIRNIAVIVVLAVVLFVCLYKPVRFFPKDCRITEVRLEIQNESGKTETYDLNDQEVQKVAGWFQSYNLRLHKAPAVDSLFPVRIVFKEEGAVIAECFVEPVSGICYLPAMENAYKYVYAPRPLLSFLKEYHAH
ncbi:MAG: hypothetical protein IIY44_07945 [Erysipelotrichales bacterium]|nr:hypothetical protein [Erysipelotrichales bacterium]MBQ1386670.1 hypothetical protein [Erysipelotrichales bacterium]MBQ2479533.1 hypothetical protein [Erysipelotrichales bacterium]MBQ4374558.1 hypothetical protein [Erysipelotrichales bacterium]MBQ5541934.1 hypothetical protein [Erysipelotrichales bacterium]